MFGEDFLSASTRVDSHHGHTDRPRSVPYRHLQVRIIRLSAKTEQNRNINKDSMTPFLIRNLINIRAVSYLDFAIIFYFNARNCYRLPNPSGANYNRQDFFLADPAICFPCVWLFTAQHPVNFIF